MLDEYLYLKRGNKNKRFHLHGWILKTEMDKAME